MIDLYFKNTKDKIFHVNNAIRVDIEAPSVP